MSDNHWETQPRKDNGEFTYRYEFWKQKLQAMEEMNKNPEVSKKYDGGSYGELRKKYKYNSDVQVHHMPAVSASYLPKRMGPGIAVDIKDHEKTSSYKSSRSAKKYRARQRMLAGNKNFLAAQEMDFTNLIRKTGYKYAKAMLEKLEYDKKLYDEGVIYG